jgi:AraC-like DNA-binding protein
MTRGDLLHEEQAMRRIHVQPAWKPLHADVHCHPAHASHTARHVHGPQYPDMPDVMPDVVDECVRIHAVMPGVVVMDIAAKVTRTTETQFRTPDEPVLCIKVMLYGRDQIQFGARSGVFQLQQGQCGAFFDPAGTVRVMLAPGELRHVNFTLTRDGLRSLVGDVALPPALRSFLRGDPTPLIWQQKASAIQRRIAMDVAGSPDHDPLNQLFLQGKTLEMLVEFIRTLEQNSASRSQLVTAREQRLLLEARELMLVNPAAPPSLDEVARQVGVTPRRLNMAFRQQYGMTMFEWFDDWKMNLARERLMGGQHAIKQIASELGYSHVNNFNLAFARHFGQPPARFRKTESSGSGGSSESD